jgi:hypothetical protein
LCTATVSDTATVGGDAGEAPGDDAAYADLLRAVRRAPHDAALGGTGADEWVFGPVVGG